MGLGGLTPELPVDQVLGSRFAPLKNFFGNAQNVISETWAPEVHDIVTTITAEYLASGPALLLPSYEETKTEMCKLARRDDCEALELK